MVLYLRYEQGRVIGPLHTGGPVALASDGEHVVTCVGEESLLTRLNDGTELRRFVAVRYKHHQCHQRVA